MWILPISLLIVFECIADVFSKEYAIHGGKTFWIIALSLYVIANVFWLWGMRDGSELGRGAILFSVASAIFAVVIGVGFFGEHVTRPELAGMILGIVSLVLILYP